MKGLTKFIFNGLTVLSLLLCVATVVLWVRSYRHVDTWQWNTIRFPDTAVVGARSAKGVESRWEIVSVLARVSVDYGYYNDYFSLDQTPGDRRYSTKTIDPSRDGWWVATRWRAGVKRPRGGWRVTHSFAGFMLQTWDYADGRNHGWGVGFPYWCATAMLAAAPAARTVGFARRRRRARQRLASGLCPSCGYDIRESPERCPECGKVTSPTTRST